MVNGNRNTHLSNTAQNFAPKWDGTATNNNNNAITTRKTLGPWDMDFKGHWEMDHDPIGEFMQQQCHGFNNNSHHQQYNNNNKKKKSYHDSNKMKINDIEDDDFMRCLPTKLIDETLDDESDDCVKKPCLYKMDGDYSISSLHSKFDEKVKAIWHSGDDNDPMKSLTYKHHFSNEDDGISLASLASSFASEKNSVGLFNFNSEQQPRNFIIEVNVPPFYNEMKSQYGGGKAFLADTYDCNNNLISNNNKQANNSVYGGRGVITKSSYVTNATASPVKYQSDNNSHFLHAVKKSDFIELGTNFQKSIWSEGYNKDEIEDLTLKREVNRDYFKYYIYEKKNSYECMC